MCVLESSIARQAAHSSKSGWLSAMRFDATHHSKTHTFGFGRSRGRAECVCLGIELCRSIGVTLGRACERGEWGNRQVVAVPKKRRENSKARQRMLATAMASRDGGRWGRQSWLLRTRRVLAFAFAKHRAGDKAHETEEPQGDNQQCEKRVSAHRRNSNAWGIRTNPCRVRTGIQPNSVVP